MRERSALLFDLLAVVGFVLIGRASHDEDEALVGFARTLWPFAVGLGVGWFVLVRRDRIRAPVTSAGSARVSAGVVTGVYTAVVGLALRALAGQGVAFSFLVVAVVVLTVFMTGWRAALVVGRRLGNH